jgi:tripartite-type tricarboxylate transporter receptor subunit TctC
MPHLAGELVKLAAGVDITHVPYRGGAPLATALVAGEVQIGFADLPILLPHIRAGTMRALAIGSAGRYPLLPDVPTFAEAGLAGVMTDNWHGFVAPARTPPAVLAALHRAVFAALSDADTAKLLQDQGAIPSPQSQAEFAAFIARETERWGEVIRRAGVKPD